MSSTFDLRSVRTCLTEPPTALADHPPPPLANPKWKLNQKTGPASVRRENSSRAARRRDRGRGHGVDGATNRTHSMARSPAVQTRVVGTVRVREQRGTFSRPSPRSVVRQAALLVGTERRLRVGGELRRGRERNVRGIEVDEVAGAAPAPASREVAADERDFVRRAATAAPQPILVADDRTQVAAEGHVELTAAVHTIEAVVADRFR